TRPMRSALGLAMLPSQVGAILLGSMGLLGLLLASVGLYGSLLYAVSRRVRGSGGRMGFGAAPPDVVRLGMRQSLSGGVAGVGGGNRAGGVRSAAVGDVPDSRGTHGRHREFRGGGGDSVGGRGGGDGRTDAAGAARGSGDRAAVRVGFIA